MGNWGADPIYTGLSTRDRLNLSRLEEVITEFPSSLKQAMFAAASHKIIARRTWNGCALNAAGSELGSIVKSSQAAADAFGITRAQATMFYTSWDKLRNETDEDATKLLRYLIEKAGLFVEPGQRVPRIVRKKVFASEQSKLREEFDTLMEANEVPDMDVALDLLVGV